MTALATPAIPAPGAARIARWRKANASGVTCPKWNCPGRIRLLPTIRFAWSGPANHTRTDRHGTRRLRPVQVLYAETSYELLPVSGGLGAPVPAAGLRSLQSARPRSGGDTADCLHRAGLH